MFLALPVPSSRFAQARRGLEQYSRSLRIVPEQNYHITVKFLGDTGREAFDRLISAMDEGPLPSKAVCLFRGLGCFPGLSDMKIIWAGMDYEKGTVDAIAAFCERAAISAGFAPETRRFVPHLTLARVKKEAHVALGLKDYIKSNSDNFFFKHEFDRIVLFESLLKRGGPEYREVKEWLLL